MSASVIKREDWEEVSPKNDSVIELSEGGWMSLQTKREAF